MATNTKAIQPAITIASSAFSPIVGEMVPLLFASMANGNAPELIRLASSAASENFSKPPEMVATPSVISALTDGLEIILSSSQIEMVPLFAFCVLVASANFCFPSSFSFSRTAL